MMKKSVFTITLLMLISFFSCKKNGSDDSTPPVISLIGLSQVATPKDSVYNDPGATAFDETDGDITSKIVVHNPVNVNTEGTYYVTYNVADNAGNNATEVKRKVVVTIF
ncbi:MAG TPA: DUF5011 domain-containing protein [Bacteroidales bacterium]|nr:DUF5011 domain-containing protein [Bacteroidales bacterium]